MPRCMITFSHLSGVSLTGPFFIRVKWGRDGFWCQNPHVTPSSKKDANGNHVWQETIVIQSKFDWKKDSVVMHVYETGIFTNTHLGDGTLVLNQLVLGQPTPVALNLTQRLGTLIVAGKLHIQIKALDFGHEIIQVAPVQETFQPHYFVASSAPLSGGAAAPQAPIVTLGGGQQLYIQPMGGIGPSTANQAMGSPTVPAGAPLAPMPTATGGFVFYAMPPTHGQVMTQMPMAAPSEPAPAYASLAASSPPQYTTDFTYEAPSAPTETLLPQPSQMPPKTTVIVEQSPPPIKPYTFDGDSLI